jgi:hypothetical protein
LSRPKQTMNGILKNLAEDRNLPIVRAPRKGREPANHCGLTSRP